MCLPNILSPVFMFAFMFHYRSFSPCGSLVFLIVSQPLWIFMFFFQQKSSLLFSITRSSSFSVIHVSVNITLKFHHVKITLKKTRHCCFFFLKSGRPCHFFPNKTLSCIWVAIPVDWIILHWHACGSDRLSGGRSVGRCTVTWLPNFLGRV